MKANGVYVRAKSFSHVPLFATLRTGALQALLFMGFSRREDWSGLPDPPLEDLSDEGIELESPVSPALQVDSLPESPGKPLWQTKRQKTTV